MRAPYNMTNQILTPLGNGLGFLHRQPLEWKVTAARTSINRFFYQMVVPYISVYIVALGASGTELGAVNALGIAVAGLVPLSWDRLLIRLV